MRRAKKNLLVFPLTHLALKKQTKYPYFKFWMIMLNYNPSSFYASNITTIVTTCATASHGRVPGEDVCIGNYTEHLGNSSHYPTFLRAAYQEG